MLKKRGRQLLLPLALVLWLSKSGGATKEEEKDVTSSTTNTDYGLGCSWPLKNGQFQCNGQDFDLIHRRTVYKNYLKGCEQVYGHDACKEEEDRRVLDNSIKPMSMINYTQVGYIKKTVPKQIMEMLIEHWHAHKDDKHMEFHHSARLPRNNMWAAPANLTNVFMDGTEMVTSSLDVMKNIVEEWTGGAQMRPVSMYGIRVYPPGAIVIPHVDRYPLILSAIINVDQDVEEPWPLEVIARDGKAVNVTLQPGEMVLYEGHSTIHSRPYPLKGKFYANAFVHFEPVGPSKIIAADTTTRNTEGASQEQYFDDGHRCPPFLIPSSPYESIWRNDHPNGWNPTANKNAMELLDTDIFKTAQMAAVWGNVAHLEQLAGQDKQVLHQPDISGYHPIHEAARFGHQGAAQFLLDHGADINVQTNDGSTPLSLAIANQINDNPQNYHPIVEFLISRGAMTREQLLALKKQAPVKPRKRLINKGK